MRMLRAHQGRRRRIEWSGFTLVEIIIALGLFSFCIVSLVFLLGTSLSSSRDTQRDAAFGAILRTVDVELRSRSSSLKTLNELTFYFNAAGGGLTTNSSSPDVIFRTVAKRLPAANTAAIAGITNTSKLSIWKVTVSYPSPTYNLTSPAYLIGNALYE